MPKAFRYLRTSSATNVGGDSDVRQRAAIDSYAASRGLEIAAEFYDAAVSGADPIDTRPGFRAMVAALASNGVRTVIVESADRFARDLIVQELGLRTMVALGVTVVTASGRDLTDNTDPSTIFGRQIEGGAAEYVKRVLVKRMRDARDRASQAAGKRVEGRKGYAVENPATVEAVRAIRVAEPRATLARIVESLTEQGILTGAGKPLHVSQVDRICRANGIAKANV